MTMLRVLGKASSINVRKVLWTCAETGVPYAREDWGSGFRALDDPAFLALNPNALVPVIVDEHGALTESNTICRYLAAKHGRTDLLPTAPRARAEVERWMDWQATELNAAWRGAFTGLVRKQPVDPAVFAASEAEWNARMRVLDARLAATGAFVAGDGFTLADIVLGLSANRWRMTPIAHAALPAVEAWMARMQDRPGFREHCANGVP
ncbi:glutathione S-transferase family protein [Falsiroseomonas sp. HW251]|uniref:glutathione S-transferase family protein n=1 Tax=Falsiroseomonas sp. HW251 TaxID=3390998 RepID=UPI003D311C61